MSSARVIRYMTKADRAEENAELIRAVFEELAETKPAGVRYEAYRLDDGVSFIHVVTLDGDDNPLMSNGAFAAFQKDIADRLVDGPTANEATVVGSY
jgi:hypothetical protein